MPGPSALPPENGYLDVRASSLAQDELARKKTQITFSKAPRFDYDELRVVVPGTEQASPGSAMAGGVTPGGLSSPLRSTRPLTAGPDKIYDVGNTLADKVASPTFRNSVPDKRTGHISMDLTSPSDPRQQHVHPAARLEVGPGTYDTDPLADHTTGMPVLSPGQSHHMMPPWKVPTRPSPAFKSPERGATAHEVNEARARDSSVHTMLPHDFASWTARGWCTARTPRAIESERWGRSTREPRPPASTLPQEIFDPQVTMDGMPGTCTAYAAAKETPAYRVAFGSGLPRLVALPAGSKQDTRTVAGFAGLVSATGPAVGPGGYTGLEPLRFRSFNTAYDASPAYYSLALGAPPPAALALNGSLSPDRVRGPSPRSPSPIPTFPPGTQRGSVFTASARLGSGELLSPSGFGAGTAAHSGQSSAALRPRVGVTTLTGPSPLPLAQHAAASGRWSSGAGDGHAPGSEGGSWPANPVDPSLEQDPDWLIHQAVVDMQRVGVRELRGKATRAAMAAPTAPAPAAAPAGEPNPGVVGGEAAEAAGSGEQGPAGAAVSPGLVSLPALPAMPTWAVELAAACAPQHGVVVLPGSGLPHAMSAPASPSGHGPHPLLGRVPQVAEGGVAAAGQLSSRPHTSSSYAHSQQWWHQAEVAASLERLGVEAGAGVFLVPPATSPPQFNQLVFLRRSVPHSALMRGQLRALKELRQARRAVRTAVAAGGRELP